MSTCRLGRAQIPEIQKNADGSVDVYLGLAAPAGKESNCYVSPLCAEEGMLEKTWKLSDVEKVNETIESRGKR